jgi:hypothetical protein
VAHCRKYTFLVSFWNKVAKKNKEAPEDPLLTEQNSGRNKKNMDRS